MEGGARAVTLALTRPLQRVWNASVGTFQRHPFLVKTLSSGVGFAFGDALTQAATRREDDPYDWRRTAAMAGAGLAVAGPVGYGFIIWMEGHVMTAAPASRLAVTTKVTLDQVVGAIIWQAALISINEPYRAGALDLWGRVEAGAKKTLPALKPKALAR